MELLEVVDVLRSEIRDNGAVYAFADEELQGYLSAARRDYSKHKPCIMEGTISLVAGQAKYDLPPDFLRFYDEPDDRELRIIGNQVRLNPAPTISAPWEFDYYAVHSWDIIQDPNPLVLFATDKVYRALAGDAARLAKYRIGRDGIEVDNSKTPENLLKLAQEARRQYEDQVCFAAYGAVG